MLKPNKYNCQTCRKDQEKARNLKRLLKQKNKYTINKDAEGNTSVANIEAVSKFERKSK